MKVFLVFEGSADKRKGSQSFTMLVLVVLKECVSQNACVALERDGEESRPKGFIFVFILHHEVPSTMGRARLVISI